MAIEIKGLDSLMAKLNAMGGDVLEALGEAVADTTLLAQGDARALAPVDTGALKQSIYTELEMDDEKVIGKVYTNIEYGPYQEMGTVNMAAHPFMKPAANANQAAFQYLAKRELQRAIRKAAK